MIGVLKLYDGIWSFEYSDEFKQQNKIKPLGDFRNVEKIYKSQTLYPRFVVRLPNLNQPKIKEVVERENIDATNEVALLKRFGERTITNPFRLLAVTSKSPKLTSNPSKIMSLMMQWKHYYKLQFFTI